MSRASWLSIIMATIVGGIVGGSIGYLFSESGQAFSEPNRLVEYKVPNKMIWVLVDRETECKYITPGFGVAYTLMADTCKSQK